VVLVLSSSLALCFMFMLARCRRPKDKKKCEIYEKENFFVNSLGNTYTCTMYLYTSSANHLMTKGVYVKYESVRHRFVEWKCTSSEDLQTISQSYDVISLCNPVVKGCSFPFWNQFDVWKFPILAIYFGLICYIMNCASFHLSTYHMDLNVNEVLCLC